MRNLRLAPRSLSLRTTVQGFRSLLLFPFRLWNWKSALLSVLIRSFALFCMVTRHGHHSGLHAAAIEACYVAVTAGFYAALQQRSLSMEPRWLSGLAVVVGVPILAQAIDYLLQHAMGTPNMKAASVGMVCWGLLSAAFHLHLMRHGAMLVGDGSRTLSSDMKRMPRLVATFVAKPVVLVIRAMRKTERAPEPGELTRAA